MCVTKKIIFVIVFLIFFAYLPKVVATENISYSVNKFNCSLSKNTLFIDDNTSLILNCNLKNDESLTLSICSLTDPFLCIYKQAFKASKGDLKQKIEINKESLESIQKEKLKETYYLFALTVYDSVGEIAYFKPILLRPKLSYKDAQIFTDGKYILVVFENKAITPEKINVYIFKDSSWMIYEGKKPRKIENSYLSLFKVTGTRYEIQFDSIVSMFFIQGDNLFATDSVKFVSLNLSDVFDGVIPLSALSTAITSTLNFSDTTTSAITTNTVNAIESSTSSAVKSNSLNLKLARLLGFVILIVLIYLIFKIIAWLIKNINK